MTEKRCFECDHCGMDMDMDPYCCAPDVVKDKPNGLYTRVALPQYCEKDGVRTLWTPRKPR